MTAKFTVYKDGDPKKGEQHTRANANDLVNGAGYTWKPRQKATPAALSPHRNVTPPTPKEPAQAVLDAHGHNPDRAVAGGTDAEPVIFDAAEDEDDEEVFDDEETFEPEAEVEADESADDVVTADEFEAAAEPAAGDTEAPAKRRGRSPRSAG